MAKPQNAFLAKIQAQATAKERLRSYAHVEIDTLAMLLAAHDVLQVGPGRSGKLVNAFLAYKLEIAEAIEKELAEDLSKKKELVVVQRDLAVLMKQILGRENWIKYRTLFPFLKDHWEWQ